MRRFALVFLAAGCVDSTGSVERTGSERSAIGEPMNGFPTPVERLGLMAINRARSDPATVAGPSSAAYPARPPVIWSYPLARSSRFQASNVSLTGVTLMHTSPCPLNTDVATSGCTGDPSCACSTPVPAMCASCAKVDAVNNTCGTAPFVRIGYFTSGTSVSATGEVAAAGYSDPMAVVDGWMDEAAGSDGHRMNLTDQGITSNTMGYGHALTGCYSTFDYSDSGKLSGAQIPKIPTAAVRPPSGAAGTFTFYATWADPTLGAPALLDVVIDGACTPMTRELGSDTLNATYKVAAALTAGCHSYFIVGHDSAGTSVTYPTSGALTIAVGGTACSSDYLTDTPAETCVALPDGGTATGTGGMTTTGAGGAKTGAGGATTTGAGGAKTGAGGATTTGAGGAKTGAGGTTGGSGVGGSVTAGVGGGGGGGTGSGGGAPAGVGGGPERDATADNGNSPPESATGGCNCSVPAGRGATRAPWGLALFAAALAGRARRRGQGRCR